VQVHLLFISKKMDINEPLSTFLRSDGVGRTMVFHPDAKVNPDHLSPSLWKTLVMCNILTVEGQEYNDQHFINHQAELAEDIEQYGKSPPTIDIRDTRSDDTKIWDPELNKSGWAGVYKRYNSSNRRDAEYFVMACADAPLAGKEYMDSLVEFPMTYGEMIADPAFIYWKNLATRNAKRLAYEVARAMKVSIPVSTDHSAMKLGPDAADKYLAWPVDSQALSSVQSIVYETTNAVAVMINSSIPTGTRHMIAVSPYDGVRALRIGPRKKKIATVALPTVTGRTRTELPPMSKGAKLKRCANVLCENEATIEAKMHPDAHIPFNNSFVKSQFIDAGWTWDVASVDGVEEYIPVVLKIGSRDLERQ
jgi:hypothetical protein